MLFFEFGLLDGANRTAKHQPKRKNQYSGYDHTAGTEAVYQTTHQGRQKGIADQG
jgi:hypothetical protein